MRGEDHAQAGRVDELQACRSSTTIPRSSVRRSVDLFLQLRRAQQVQFAVQPEHDAVQLAADIDSKMLLGDRHTLDVSAAAARPCGTSADRAVRGRRARARRRARSGHVLDLLEQRLSSRARAPARHSSISPSSPSCTLVAAGLGDAVGIEQQRLSSPSSASVFVELDSGRAPRAASPARRSGGARPSRRSAAVAGARRARHVSGHALGRRSKRTRHTVHRSRSGGCSRSARCRMSKHLPCGLLTHRRGAQRVAGQCCDRRRRAAPCRKRRRSEASRRRRRIGTRRRSRRRPR